MFYQILADVTVAIHLAYVAYVVFGQLLIVLGIPLKWQWIRNRWFRITHLAMILIVAGEALANLECPLTVWEDELLELSGQPAHERSFVGRLLDSWLFVDCSDQGWVLPSAYIGTAVLVLATFLLAPPRWRGKAATKDNAKPQAT